MLFAEKPQESLNNKNSDLEVENQEVIKIKNRDLNYLVYKEFLVHMGMLSEAQASLECRESALIYDAWFSLG